MGNLNLNVDEEIGIIEKYHLSPNELYVIRAILIAQEEDNQEYFVRYMQIPESIRGGLREHLVNLRDRGIILKSYKVPAKGESFIIEDVDFNKAFTKALFRASDEMGEELFNHYPQFTTINNSVVPLRGVSKKFDTLEDAFKYYGKVIKWKEDAHREVIDLVDWAKEHNILNCSLASFIIDRKWLDLKAMRDGDSGNINFDTVKLL